MKSLKDPIGYNKKSGSRHISGKRHRKAQCDALNRQAGRPYETFLLAVLVYCYKRTFSIRLECRRQDMFVDNVYLRLLSSAIGTTPVGIITLIA
jgi:hypothetical protein